MYPYPVVSQCRQSLHVNTVILYEPDQATSVAHIKYMPLFLFPFPKAVLDRTNRLGQVTYRACLHMFIDPVEQERNQGIVE